MSARLPMRSIAASVAILALAALAGRAAATESAAPAGRDTARVARASVARAASAGKQAAAPAAARPRRLEDIPIEGDVTMPQVLFITGRDQRRIPCVHHRRYLPEAKALGEATVLPARLAVAGAAPAAASR
jgi:hypothetical protein